MKPLIDSDVLLYEIGFSSEKFEEINGEKVLVPAPWEFCQELFDKKIKLIEEEVGATSSPLLFLTNTKHLNKVLNKERKRQEKPPTKYVENFRVEVAKEKEYKGGRSDVKPFHFKNLLAYIRANYDVHINEAGLEADDAMCIYQIQNAKECGVAINTHAGKVLVDYEDWLKYQNLTFIVDNKGYVVNDTGKGDTRKVWSLHRDIMGNPEGMVVDHINGDKMDCRKYNLRVCSVKENVRNSKPQTGTSDYKGVYWDAERLKWSSSIKANGISIFLGRFDDELLAAQAYDEAAKKYFGDFARLNLEKPYKKPFVETIICSRDKDVRQCPLWHYSWECGKQASVGPLFVDELGFLEKRKDGKIWGVGDKFFYYQLLVGDAVDNIGGIKGRGPAFAFNLLKDATTSRECYELVGEVFVKTYEDSWKTHFREMADLLWMVRRLDEKGEKVRWSPPQRLSTEMSG